MTRLTWSKLTDRQREVLRRLLGLVHDAASNAASYESRRSPSWLMEQDCNQVAFINGKFATGKTDLVLSLARLLSGGKSVDHFFGAEQELCASHRSIASQLIGRAIVVEPLYMESLPSGTPLLTAILSRVRQGVISQCCESRCRSELFRFDQMMERIARSLDSNLDQRREHLDREQYGQNVIEQEHDRCELRSHLADALWNLSQQVVPSHPASSQSSQPLLFVVPIEDVHLNPSRCVDLFRVLRNYATPNLFYVSTGDLSVVRMIFQMHAASEYGMTADPSSIGRDNVLRFIPDYQCINL